MTTSKDLQPMIYYRLVSHCKPVGPIISKLQALLSFSYSHLTLKERPKVKSEHIKRFAGHDFL